MALSKIQVPALGVGSLGSNLIINGDFRISQRGDYSSATSVTNDQKYMDRWTTRFSGVTANIQAILGTNSSPGYPYTDSNSLRLTATSSATGILRHLQRVEGFLDGQTLTFSAWVKSNSANARLFQYQHNGGTRVASAAHSGGGGWEFLSVTVENNATTGNQLYFDAAIGTASFGTLSITSGQYIEISQVQLEVRDAPSPFMYRSIGEELALCQRYFQVLGGTGNNYPLASGFTSTSGFFGYGKLIRTMRASPSFSHSGSASHFSYTHAAVSANASSSPTFGTNPNTYYLSISSSTTTTNNAGAYARITNSGTLAFFDSEL